nr:immunoglobulin light chain junction region [Macaca mulatta]
CQQGNSYPLSF